MLGKENGECIMTHQPWHQEMFSLMIRFHQVLPFFWRVVASQFSGSGSISQHILICNIQEQEATL
jgi:hypothetical protein